MSRHRGRLVGVGIDLVETERAKRLVQSHPGGVARFLTPEENRLVRAARDRASAFALVFAAKEAASKSVGQSLSGPGMFRHFRVSRQGRRLRVRWAGPGARRVRIELFPFFWNRLAGMLAYSYSTHPSRLVK